MPLRLRPDIATTDTDDGLVLLDERAGGYWQLNRTGAHVLAGLLEGRDPDHIARDLATRQAVVAVSLRCTGKDCLQRSIAATLYCRAHGTWPTWCTGVRTHPFAAHAWIQVDDQPIGEPHPAGHYQPILTIPPTHREP